MVRVPAIVWAPRLLPQGRRVEALIQHIDLAPLLFELAGCRRWRIESVQNASVVRGGLAWRDAVYAEQGTERVLRDVALMTMIRTHDWKLVHYLDQPWGDSTISTPIRRNVAIGGTTAAIAMFAASSSATCCTGGSATPCNWRCGERKTRWRHVARLHWMIVL